MLFKEQRKATRSRVLYGGMVAFNRRQSTVSCIVRNYSRAGAKIVMENPALLPDRVDLIIDRKSRAYFAAVVWRRESEAGLSFEPSFEANAPIPIDWARRLRVLEKERKALEARLDQLTSGY